MTQRPETGPMKFGDDWTGVFIRGDSAFYYAQMLNLLLGEDVPADFARKQLEGLITLLASSNENAARKEGEEVQLLKPFTDCTQSR